MHRIACLNYLLTPFYERLRGRFPRSTRPVIHCETFSEAECVFSSLKERLASCGLEIHEGKSSIAYCKDDNRRLEFPRIKFNFLGFTFQPRLAKRKDGKRFMSFLPAVSESAKKKMRQRIKSWNIPNQTPGEIEEFAKAYNPVMRGWINYYGCFYKSEMCEIGRYLDRKLALWVSRKYKPLRRRKRASLQWLGKYANRNRKMFFHWNVLGMPSAG